MSGDLVASLVLGGLVAAVAGTALFVATLSRRWSLMAQAFARQWRLPYPPDIEAWVISRTRIRVTTQLVAVGIAGGAILATVPYFLLTASPDAERLILGMTIDVQFIVAWLIIPVANVIAHSVAAAVTKRRPGPRVARLSTVSLADVTPPVIIWTVRVLWFLPLTMLPLWLLLPADRTSRMWPHHPWPVAFVIAGAVPVTGLFVEAWQRHIVNGPQRAASGLELAYDDAFRASAVHMLSLITVWVSSLGVSFVAAPALDSAPHRSFGAYALVTFGPVAIGVVIQLVMSTPWVRTHFRSRLAPGRPTPATDAFGTPQAGIGAGRPGSVVE
jgi:hypothetical protein